MKVILLKDVSKVGRKYDVKLVSDGYALNFLIPNKLAESSTPAGLKRLETLKAADLSNKKVQEDLLMKNLKSLEGAGIELKEKANDKGHLFKGIHKEEIIAAIKKQTQLDMTAEHIILEKPLKEVGEYTIEVKVQDKTSKFKITVTAL